MAIRTYLTGLGLNQLFMLDDATLDPGSNGLTTTLTTPGAQFIANPVCEGVTNSLRTDTIPGYTNASDEIGAQIANTADINTAADIFRRRCVFVWVRPNELDTSTCIFEQGGGTNNLAILTGLGGVFTAQAADSGQQFLIASAREKTQVNRAYLVALVWEHNTVHAGAGNRVAVYVNGVLGEVFEGAGATDVFPSHGGNITLGNTEGNLQSYNSSSILSVARRKWLNMLGMINDSANFTIDATAATTLREIFERTVLAETVIAADTVANQQAALTALDGTNYGDVNCAIRIYQATDATDYTLTLSDVTFTENINLDNIFIQYVGPNTLTIQLTTTIDPLYTSVPAEVETTAAINPGGGTLVILPPPNTLTVTVVFSGGTPPADYEWRLYANDPTPGIIGTVELAGAENETSNSISYDYVFTAADLVSFQIIATGYQEFLAQYTLAASNQTFIANVQFDPNI